jgi:hypothetical protein
MKPVEWYHARDNKQFGPVSTAELKQLAQSGNLRPDDLVWREGLEGWIPAKKVKGLFEENGQTPPVVAKPVAVSAAAPSSAASNDSPSPADPAAKSVPAPPSHLHPLDRLLVLLRRQFTPSFVEAASQLFTLIGHYALYGIVVVTLGFFVTSGIKDGNFQDILWGLGLALVFGVLQYTASRFCAAIGPASRIDSASLGSTLLPDCLALIVMAGGVAGLVGLTVQAIQIESYRPILDALSLFIICQFAAFAAFHPASLGISVAVSTRLWEEALGALALAAKTMLRTLPVIFGVFMVRGLVDLGHACYLLYQDVADSAQARASDGLHSLLFFALLPLTGYVAFLLYSLLVAAAGAVVSLGKSESSATIEGNGEEKDEKKPAQDNGASMP